MTFLSKDRKVRDKKCGKKRQCLEHDIKFNYYPNVVNKKARREGYKTNLNNSPVRKKIQLDNIMMPLSF